MSEIVNRFRGFLPIVIDLETAGTNPAKDALLEMAAVSIDMDDKGFLFVDKTEHCHIQPFEGANLDDRALEFTGIDPYHPFRFAITEKDAFEKLFNFIKEEVKRTKCTRAVLVAHNAWFDMSFINSALKRLKITKQPFHAFTTFDTATLSGLCYGQTVLAKACRAAKVKFDENKAHSALYDAKQTALLFCEMVNRYKILGGWN